MSDETKYPSQLAERFQVRMPDGLRDRIRKSAEENKRSMNAEIVYLLTYALDDVDHYKQRANIPSDKKTTASVFRAELEKIQSFINQVISDVENPSSGMNQAAREMLEEKTGLAQDPKSTPANRLLTELDDTPTKADE